MAVRQYIGARYVPKFYEGSNGSQWDSGVQYEALTIVQHLTNTYCSKKTVPSTVGAPNLNPEYWANIGLLGEVQTDIEQVKSDLNELSTKVDKSLTEVTQSITGINTRINNVRVGNIIDYGADPSGVSVSTTAIQTCINENDITYIPTGNYLIDNTIVIPSDKVIFGAGLSSEVKLKAGSNCDMFVSEKWYQYKETEIYNLDVHNIQLFNFTINGNRVADPDAYPYDTTVLNSSGCGVCVYCDNVKLEKMTIYNCAYDGLVTEGPTYLNGSLASKGTENLASNCRITSCGHTGWSYWGMHDSKICNTIVGGNNRSNGSYSNLDILKGNGIFSNCHFYSSYGEVKVAISVNINPNASPCRFIGCDIEGGSNVCCVVGADDATFTNCSFYASFGTSDVYINAKRFQFIGCKFGKGLSGTEGTPAKSWKGAIEFASNEATYGLIICECDDTPLTTYVGYKYHNTYVIAGFNQTTAINGKYYAMPMPPEWTNMTEENIIINGGFDDMGFFTWLNNMFASSSNQNSNVNNRVVVEY